MISSRSVSVRRWLAVAPLVLCAWLLPAGAFAQNVTSGSLSGVAQDQQGGVLPGASVEATHVPTGTAYSTVTGGDGRFVFPSVRVGGPYTITVSLSGFQPATQKDINISLAKSAASRSSSACRPWRKT